MKPAFEIYDRQSAEVGNLIVSMIRCTRDLHAGDFDSRAEILIYQKGEACDPAWVGPPHIVADLWEWTVSSLKRHPVEDVENKLYDYVQRFRRPSVF